MNARKKLDAPAQQPAFTEPLHVKYRPKTLDEVWGQDDACNSLRATIKAKARPHTFLFVGPAGTGKTTLARIMADEFGIPPQNIVEHDAASKSGIDDMRGITEALRYNGFGDTPNKAIILNECQGLSKQAWDSLLTTTEEPPPHVFFFFTSTDPAKIPKAMVTRSVTHYLRAVRRDDLLDVLEKVREKEELETSDKILGMVADAAEGSVRSALTLFAKVQDVTDPSEAADLLQTPLENAEVIDVCRQLIGGKLRWPRLVEMLTNMKETPAETIRILITLYITSCAIGARSEKDALHALTILRAFATPYNASDKMAPLLLSFDRLMFD